MHQFQIILNRQYFILSSLHLKFSRCRRSISMSTFFIYSRNRGNFPVMAYCTVNKHSYSFIIIKSSTSWPVSSSPGCRDACTLQGPQLWLGKNCHYGLCGYITSPVEGDRRSMLLQVKANSCSCLSLTYTLKCLSTSLR